jgi:D-amino-acid dehydrogenase
MKVVIIGGGIIGLSCAYYLEKKGYDITVIDKGDITKGCSFGNAGYVSPSHFTPLASPGIIAQGLRWMLSSSSPFYIKPRMNPDLIKWGLAFWRNANKETATRNAPHLNQLLQLSRRLTSEIKNELGDSFLMEEKGCLMLYRNADTEKHEIELAEKAAAFGIETKMLSAEQVQELEPEVKVDVRGGVLYPIDAHLHPGQFMQSLLNHLIQRGVKIVSNSSVKGFERANGKIHAAITSNDKIDGDEFILAAGSWLPVVTKLLGIRILLQPGKGYSMTFNQVERNLQYPAILVDDRVAMTPLGRDLRMGGTMEISGINERVLIKRAKAIFSASKKYYPDLPLEFPEVDRVWTGLRPLSPDGLPYIGRTSKYDNLVIAGGHAMIGISLAAGTGKIVEEMVSRTPTEVPAEAFAVERFN